MKYVDYTELEAHSNLLLKQTKDSFIRYLLSELDWTDRMIAISGARGTGKTTMLLQRMKFGLPKHEKSLYVSADHPWFFANRLIDLAPAFFMNGGKHLFIDEVHKYPFWSRELKTIHDGFPEMKIVFSASSALGIYQGEADLSRRVVTYNLPGLSFREYLSFFHGIHLPKFGLDDLLAHHTELAKNLSEDFRPLMYFEAYLTSGYYPFAKESSGIGFKIKLAQAINATIESDLAAIEGYNAGGASRLKRLLAAIAESSPFTPNISQLASKLEMSRDTVYQYLGYLENGKLVNMLMREGRGEAKFQKPDKIYLENTNLAYTLSANPDLGNLRETFLMNQLNNVTGGEVNLPSAGDFFTHGCTIEVGGSKKTKRQVKAAIKPIVAADGIEVGSTNIIPLWMFGMLY